MKGLLIVRALQYWADCDLVKSFLMCERAKIFSSRRKLTFVGQPKLNDHYQERLVIRDLERA